MDAFPRVLLVDDDPVWYKRVRDLLHKEKLCRVDWAETPGDCRKEVERHHHHVVIVDLDLNHDGNPQPGLELTTELTGNYFIQLDRYTAVVTLSHHGEPPNRNGSYSAGSLHFQPKPRTCEEHEIFNSEFPKMINSHIVNVDRLRDMEVKVSRPLSEKIEKGNIRMESNPEPDPNHVLVFVSNEPIDMKELRPAELAILRILMESSYPVPPDALMRQGKITTRKSLDVTLSTLRKTVQNRIPLSDDGYSIRVEKS